MADETLDLKDQTPSEKGGKAPEKGGKKGPDQKQLNIAKDTSVDFPVEVIATEADPYHETGAKFHAGTKKAKELVARGWVTMAKMIALFILISFGSMKVQGQASVLAPLYNGKTTYSLANLQAATATRDTVTDTGTGALYAKRIAGPGQVTIQVHVTKVSGTVTGSLVLAGSNDGVYYSTINTEETQTAIASASYTNATGTTSYQWRLKTNPFLYYRISASGGTTTVYYLDGFIMKH